MAANSSSGLKKETAGALSYVLGPFTGILFLLLETDPFVKFHALQSVVFSVAVIVLNSLLTLTVVLAFLVPLLVLVEFVLWLVLIYKASQGEMWEVPLLSTLTRRFVK